ncbi:bifunctional diaminohydroxyphosphoribosylaminopyrimidine deaminase/5-amino-6-(5-phosphoribosylamino)uracil reductase RibD [Silvibacterium dinghuense]|uniref:Riboflavin biosynthesis protein RibD n=2 Tax=Silvibacterium dinghuense TaxID=1560006 RepID=A0A4Q1SCG5_9BACT|nr:bifunctional diaminohydroxyphosphoribosylaminopyrimidine deaminase/5-amino-6-(5-phosphoribosylamino)uracil reductase RibD [Silvibacterium dinghuense]
MRWMQRALGLARQSIGLASPNPHVGCVLVKNGAVVGEGFHVYDRRDHAEIVALKAAGDAARGATAYVTLEPCSHTGRTGPCADALIAAGVARVVVATGDPNPQVNGQGMARIRAAGITVETDVCMDASRALNMGFARSIVSGVPFVTLKAGVSLDGRIAPAPSARPAGPPAAVMLTGEESRAEVQRMRHASDAILTGIHTVLADDPLLTDRSGLARRRPLLRVVLDSALRIPLDSKLVRTAVNDVLVFCTTPNPERRKALEVMGIEVEVLAGNGARVDLHEMLRALDRRGILSLLLECGSQLNGAFLREALVDRVTLFYAPVLLGEKAVPLIAEGEEVCWETRSTSSRHYGPDVCITTELRDPWRA